MKAKYHDEQAELEMKMKKEKEIENEKEKEEDARFKRELTVTQMKMMKHAVESTEGTSLRPQKGRFDSAGFVDEEDDVFLRHRGSKRKESVKQRSKRINSLGTMSEVNELEREDSGKPPKGTQIVKERGQDMNRLAHNVEGVWYWDRIQNQNIIDNRGVTEQGVKVSYRKKYK